MTGRAMVATYSLKVQSLGGWDRQLGFNVNTCRERIYIVRRFCEDGVPFSIVRFDRCNCSVTLAECGSCQGSGASTVMQLANSDIREPGFFCHWMYSIKYTMAHTHIINKVSKCLSRIEGGIEGGSGNLVVPD